MADALRNQNKPVTYRKFAGDNHSLIETENRRETLAAVSDFLAKHIGPSAAGKASTE
jgi:dipeptidyl aminopeptidase/acylaminoacyl peptidase